MEIKRILSGITTSGDLHLGNYLGALKNWIKLQDQAPCFYFLADLHAITTPQNPEKLQKSIFDIVTIYLACGLDPKKSALFAQSSVYTHSYMAWILNCVCKIGWLNRMTQFKDKSGKNKENASVGLYTYPILQAADILLYKPTHVPVGEDQKQHIELTRDIAQAFNREYNTELFVVPEPLIMGQATRVMSLRDGTKKMSKSDESDNSRINLYDDADTIKLKIQKAKSDSELISSENLESRPELVNLANIFAALTNNSKENVIEQFSGKGFSELKKALTDVVINEITPISNEIKKLEKNSDYIKSILIEGKNKALEASEPLVKEAKEIIGFINL